MSIELEKSVSYSMTVTLYGEDDKSANKVVAIFNDKIQLTIEKDCITLDGKVYPLKGVDFRLKLPNSIEIKYRAHDGGTLSVTRDRNYIHHDYKFGLGRYGIRGLYKDVYSETEINLQKLIYYTIRDV